MPREPKGEVCWTDVGPVARVTIEGRERQRFELPTCRTEQEADERAELLAGLARRFRKAGVIRTPDAAQLLQLAATSAPGLLPGVLQVAGELIGGELAGAGKPAVPTFAELAKRWTSGELHRDYPDHVRSKDASHDQRRLAKLCAADVGGILLGAIPIDRFTLEHAEAAMRQLPAEAKRPATRRAYAQLLHRVLALAVYPCRLIAAHPLPRGFMPRIGKPPSYAYLYPAEDAKLRAAPGARVPLPYRLLYGFLVREGMRTGEAAALQFRDLNLEIGTVSLDENKTDDARTWALDPGVTRALKAWRDLRGAGPADRVFVDEYGRPLADDKLAERLRAHLEAAGIDRPELLTRGVNRGRLRAHDLRATFVTLALAQGRSEAWVADRTGHRSSQMINRYRRAARSASELGLGPLGPLDENMPDLIAPGLPQKHTRPLGGMADAGDLKGETSQPEHATPRKYEASTDEQERVATPAGQSRGNQTPRERMIAALNTELGAAIAEGDLEAAKVAHEALGRLLGGATPGPVLDLATERRRRR